MKQTKYKPASLGWMKSKAIATLPVKKAKPNTPNITNPAAMYSLIAYFIAYKMIDVTITGLEESKGVMIITDESNSQAIADALNARLGRGVTVLYGEGGYLKQPKHALYSVVTRLEITKLKDIVYETDSSAFITISDVYDVFGGQFGKKNIH